MITVEFSEQDLKAIAYERFHHPVPRVQRRMEVLWLKSQGLSHQRIAKLAGVCGNAVTKYLKMYILSTSISSNGFWDTCSTTSVRNENKNPLYLYRLPGRPCEVCVI